MTKQQFNRAVAERVMGWTTYPDNDDPFNEGQYCYDVPDALVDGPDFTTDYNAAAMVRGRVVELGKFTRFIDELYLIVFPSATIITGTYAEVTAIMNATPAQTARAAYMAITGEELEAVDE